MKHWQVLSQIDQQKNKKAEKRQEEIIKILLKNRGLTTKKRVDEFYNPPDPSALHPRPLGINAKEISKAVERIKRAIKSGEKIIVYGDYDADGICGTAIMWETLHACGADVLPYIPHRVEEGYGLSQKGIDNLLSHKLTAISHTPSLIITVDHGITARKELDYAISKGLDVIITDHHQKPKILPKSYTTVWTDKISGAAVAWILAKEITASYAQQNLGHLDLVAIATIADMIPLKGFNRSLVKFGLLDLNQTKRPGLLALMAAARLTPGGIGVYDVSFILAPRLNASGRIEHAVDSLRLLCTRDHQKAKVLAQKLDETNRERQRLTEEAFIHARSLVKITDKLIFISHHSYNEGVIGLVAGKLTEEFYRPAIVVSEGKPHSKASARSINGFNIIEILRRLEDLLLDCGGHPMAAGFTIETALLQQLKTRLLELAQKEITDKHLEKVLKVDCEIELTDINWPLFEKIKKFEPFGFGNPEPVFLTHRVRIKDLRVLGNEGKHLKLLIDSNHTPFSAIGFGFGEWGQKLKIGDKVDLVYTLLVDSWNGEEKLQLKIKDIRLFPS